MEGRAFRVIPPLDIEMNHLQDMDGGEGFVGESGMEETPKSILATAGVNLQVSRASVTCLGRSLIHWVMLIGCVLANLVGASAGTLLGRLYFVQGGTRRLLYAMNQSAGWPILVLPLMICYWRGSTRPTPCSIKLILIYTLMGCLITIGNLMYSWGLSFLPVSTSTLLCSSQLAFNAIFAYILVRQKFTFYVLNSVVVITMSAALLAVHANSDRPIGTTSNQYIAGYVMTILASGLYGLSLTLMEVIYTRVLKTKIFIVVLESQICINAASTILAVIGMWIMGDFRKISKEAAHFGLGASLYSLTLIWSAIGWQLLNFGSAGMIFLASSLMCCVFMTASLPVVPILAVIFFHDNFTALKGMAMVVSIWGFLSYVYGAYSSSKKADGNGDPQPT